MASPLTPVARDGQVSANVIEVPPFPPQVPERKWAGPAGSLEEAEIRLDMCAWGGAVVAACN